MKPKKEKLFSLIKRLEPSEKKFISERLKFPEGNYLYVFFQKLLSEAQKGNSYKEDKIRAYLHKKFPDSKKKFRKQKFLLYENILELLYILHEKHTGNKLLKSGKVQILIQKGFWKEADIRLKKLTVENENNPEALTLCYRLHYDIYNRQPISKKLIEKYLINFEKQQQNLKTQMLQWKYYEFTIRLHEIKNLSRSVKKQKQALKEILAGFQQTFPYPPRVPILRIAHYDFFRFFYFIKQDYSKSWRYGKKIIDLFQNNPSLLRQRHTLFVSHLNNMIYIALMENQWKKVLNILTEMKLFLRSLPHTLKTDLIEFLLLSELMYLHSTNKNKKALQELPQLINLYKKYSEIISPPNKIWIHWGFSIIYYQCKQYENAIFWIQKNLLFPMSEIQEEYYSFMYMVFLIYHLESKNTELLPYLLRRFYRYLLQKKDILPIEKTVLTFFKKYIGKSVSIKELLLGFQRELKANPEAAKYNRDIFDFLQWTEEQLKQIN